MKDNIDKTLHNKLHPHSLTPPEGTWEAISRTLAATEERTLAVRVRRVRLARYAAAACLLFAVVTVGGLYVLRGPALDDAAVLADGAPGAARAIRLAPIAVVYEVGPLEKTAQPTHKISVIETARQPEATVAQTQPVETNAAQEAKPQDFDRFWTDVTEGREQKTSPAETYAARSWQASYEPWQNSYNPFRSARSLGHVKRRLTGSLYAANFGNSASDNSLSTNSYRVITRGGLLTDVTVFTSVSHRMPLSAGLDLAFDIGKRLNIETGITYTYLRSDYEIDNVPVGRTVRQELNYLGIPVALTYTFARTDRFEFYLRGGAMLEKGIYGNRRTTLASGDTSDQKVNMNGFCPSLTAGVGAELKFNRRLGIYFEPGVNYYPSMSGQPDSYRTENPLNFSLRAGLRINLRK